MFELSAGGAVIALDDPPAPDDEDVVNGIPPCLGLLKDSPSPSIPRSAADAAAPVPLAIPEPAVRSPAPAVSNPLAIVESAAEIPEVALLANVPTSAAIAPVMPPLPNVGGAGIAPDAVDVAVGAVILAPALDDPDVAVPPCAKLNGLSSSASFLSALPKGGIALDAAPSSNGPCIPPLEAAKLCIALDADIGPDAGPDVDVANGIGPRPILPIEVLAPSIPLPIAELVARAPLAIPEAAALAPLRIAVPATPAPVAIPEPAARTPVPIAVPTVLAPLPIALAAMPAPPAITVPAVLSPVFPANWPSPPG